MKSRKRNRMKGFDYSSNNLYFITNCVKNNVCCFGNVISVAPVGTGRDLSVHSENHHSENHHSENHHSENHHSENHHSENHHSENHHSENHHSENHHSENHHSENHHSENHHSENHHSENHHPENHHSENHSQNIAMQLNQFGAIVKNQIEWLMVQYPYIDIHNFVIMPNHFHLILEIDSLRCIDKNIKIKSVSGLMGALKTTTSRLIHEASFENFAWHRSFHDHIIRNESEYYHISNYIDNNPQKWFQDCFFAQI